jgi:hypothetical protein
VLFVDVTCLSLSALLGFCISHTPPNCNVRIVLVFWGHLLARSLLSIHLARAT